jgi:hypothetical protein
MGVAALPAAIYQRQFVREAERGAAPAAGSSRRAAAKEPAPLPIPGATRVFLFSAAGRKDMTHREKYKVIGRNAAWRTHASSFLAGDFHQESLFFTNSVPILKIPALQPVNAGILYFNLLSRISILLITEAKKRLLFRDLLVWFLLCFESECNSTYAAMKAMTLTIRGCPARVHRALEQSAKANHRSLNGEALAWLERQVPEKPVTGKQAAAALRKFQKLLTPAEHGQIAAGIEQARSRMAHVHLH